jgi:hypothetical protein
LTVRRIISKILFFREVSLVILWGLHFHTLLRLIN